MKISRHGITLDCHHNKGSGGILYLREWDEVSTGIKLNERNYDLLCRFLYDVEDKQEESK